MKNSTQHNFRHFVGSRVMTTEKRFSTTVLSYFSHCLHISISVALSASRRIEHHRGAFSRIFRWRARTLHEGNSHTSNKSQLNILPALIAHRAQKIWIHSMRGIRSRRDKRNNFYSIYSSIHVFTPVVFFFFSLSVDNSDELFNIHWNSRRAHSSLLYNHTLFIRQQKQWKSSIGR